MGAWAATERSAFGKAPVGQQPRVDAMGEGAQLVERAFRLEPELADLLDAGAGIGLEEVLDKPEPDPQGD